MSQKNQHLEIRQHESEITILQAVLTRKREAYAASKGLRKPGGLSADQVYFIQTLHKILASERKKSLPKTEKTVNRKPGRALEVVR